MSLYRWLRQWFFGCGCGPAAPALKVNLTGYTGRVTVHVTTWSCERCGKVHGHWLKDITPA